MPTDQSLDSATATTRRTFLARTAVGGALVTAGAVALPLGHLLPGAGAQESQSDLLTDLAFATFASPLEMAAVQGYQAAIASSALDAAWTSRAQSFQTHHQAVVDTLAPFLSEDDPAPMPDSDLSSSTTKAIKAAGSDQDGVLKALAALEDTLAATHLSAIPMLRESSTAKIVAQVLSVESQQAALLATASGSSAIDAAPGKGSTDGAVAIDMAGMDMSTTTTAAN